MLLYLRIDQLGSLVGTLNTFPQIANFDNIDHTNNNERSEVLVLFMVGLEETKEEDAKTNEENANRNNENDQLSVGKDQHRPFNWQLCNLLVH